MLPGLLVVAPATTRFTFARDRLAGGAWEPAYKLSSGHKWWRCLRLAAKRGELHPCAERLGKHLSWQLGDGVTLTNIRSVLGSYAAYHGLSLRTAWTDWGRLVATGWLSPTRAPANQGRCRPQGPGSGRAARYVLTAPTQVITQLRSRSRPSVVTSLDTFSLEEASPSPSVPPRKLDHQRRWITLQDPTTTERRDASALLAGCHELWRRQHPDNALLTRPDWQRLLPLVAKVQAQRPDVPLSAVLTDRVASARSLPDVLAWRLWRLLPRQTWLLRAYHLSDNASQHLATGTDRTSQVRLGTSDEETIDWQEHLPAVRALGGPAAVRAALRAVEEEQAPSRRTPVRSVRTDVRAYGR